MANIACSTLTWGRLSTADGLRGALHSIKREGYAGVGLEYGLLPSGLRKNTRSLSDLIKEYELDVAAVAINPNPELLSVVSRLQCTVVTIFFLNERLR